MKNKYEKPMLEVIPFELNETIASGCGLKIYNHADRTSCQETDQWIELKGMTGATLTDDINCESVLEGYCYVTSNGIGTSLFNS